jgi:hypothetical protein
MTRPLRVGDRVTLYVDEGEELDPVGVIRYIDDETKTALVSWIAVELWEHLWALCPLDKQTEPK